MGKAFFRWLSERSFVLFSKPNMSRMKKILILFLVSIYVHGVAAQSVAVKLANAIKQFEADQQLRHGIISLCVADAQTGKTLYEHYSQLGLPAASTQKLFTSGAAFELLGASYRYKTQLGYKGSIKNEVLKGEITIIGSGDPTLGSWRYNSTKEEVILDKWMSAINNLKIKKVEGGVWCSLNKNEWSSATIPDGWIWQDIGNYYGAGCDILNWHENQYDLILRPGKAVGEKAEIIGTKPKLFNAVLNCEVTTGDKNSGDNAFIYLAPYSEYGYVRGTIPMGASEFTISGSFPKPALQLISTVTENLRNHGITVDSNLSALRIDSSFMNDKKAWESLFSPNIISVHYSPPLDSINYWFLRKSINLYGEALIKTIAFEKSGFGSTEKGVELVRNFWAEHGIDKSAINIIDGSGLSPQNRVTTDAEVKVLQYAKTRPWFNAFYNALPEYNGMKMKSGSIGGSRAFAGYHTAKNGKQFIFSIIVNNYDGSAAEMVKKMYKVLDVLK